jgi:electron transfer flavoprotein alpha subunit
MNVLFLSHVEADGSLCKAASEALGAAKGLGGELTVGLYGADVQKAADQIAGCGAAKFLGVAGADFTDARYATDAAADRKSTRLNSSHRLTSRMPSSA